MRFAHSFGHLQAGSEVEFDIPGYYNNILETLSTIRSISFVYIDLSRIPNLKQLKIIDTEGIVDRTMFDRLKGLVSLQQLEKLNLMFRFSLHLHQFNQRKWSRRNLIRPLEKKQIPWCDLLPHSLKQLTISGSRLLWENMNILAKLPSIEVLKLKRDAFLRRVYEQTVEGFPRLKVLLFEGLELNRWIADTIHYPILQHLVVRRCFSLKVIPCYFEEIETLKSIELVWCPRSLEKSAKPIQQEQQNNGSDIQVFISSLSHPEGVMHGEMYRIPKKRRMRALDKELRYSHLLWYMVIITGVSLDIRNNNMHNEWIHHTSCIS